MSLISVITATYNAEHALAKLVRSLESQVDQGFEWVVIDGESSDTTLEIASSAKVCKKIISEPDFGIYDALNKGVRMASGDYYLVLGADDVLSSDAIFNYRKALERDGGPPDMITATVLAGGVYCKAKPGKSWLYGMAGYISCHSVGALIRRSLHDRFGYYSRRLPIAADQLFIKTAASGGAEIVIADFLAGEYGVAGTSSVDTLGALTEIFRVQVETEKCVWLQIVLFMLRLCKNGSWLRRS